MEMWDFYRLMDNDMELEEEIAETERKLFDDDDRKGIADYLKDFVENANDEDCASEAANLYREVMDL